jgi:hypothetical protein
MRIWTLTQCSLIVRYAIKRQIADGGSDVDDGRAVAEAAASAVRHRSAAVFPRFSWTR